MNIDEALARIHVAVVIPAYQAEATIAEVVRTLPAFVRTVVIVDDASTDGTAAAVEALAAEDARVESLRHERNGGVGAAMRSGYRRALEMGADVVAKLDSDGQMDPAYLARLVAPIAIGATDYTKGNRFLRPDAIHEMPKIRLAGNAALSLLTKLSSGYWHVLDPTNGYTAASAEALRAIDLDRVDDRFFFESSMLVELGMARAVIDDVAVPSRYRGETSHLSVTHSLVSFGPKHVSAFARRLLYRYVLTDFSAVSLLLGLSVPLTTFGVVFGTRAWIRSALYDTPSTAGTVMLAAFTTAGGLYCLVQAMIYDMLATPRRPLTVPRIGLVPPGEVTPPTDSAGSRQR